MSGLETGGLGLRPNQSDRASATPDTRLFGEKNCESLTIAVRTGRSQVEAFKSASFNPAPGVPLAFAFCWLTLPEIRAKISELIGPSHFPLHESQDFQIFEPLALDTDFIFHVEFQRIDTPQGLNIRATAARLDGEALCHFTAVLRSLPFNPETA